MLSKFRFVTCGFVDINEFREEHMMEDDKPLSSSDDEYDIPQAENLRGFRLEQKFESEPSPIEDKQLNDSRQGLKRINESSVVESESPDKVDMIFPEHVKIML